MISRTACTALLLGLALVATPVLAASVTSIAGNTGPADLDNHRSAPLTLPGNVTAMPTPTVTDGATRDFTLSPDPANLDTVSYSHGGTVTRTPASEGLRAILETEIAGNRAGN